MVQKKRLHIHPFIQTLFYVGLAFIPSTSGARGNLEFCLPECRSSCPIDKVRISFGPCPASGPMNDEKDMTSNFSGGNGYTVEFDVKKCDENSSQTQPVGGGSASLTQTGQCVKIDIPEEVTKDWPVVVVCVSIRKSCNQLWSAPKCVSNEKSQDCGEFERGDSNGDGSTDISDAITTLKKLFQDPTAGDACEDSQDANDDGEVDISDPVSTLNSLFGNGGPLPPPSGETGSDPTNDNLHSDPPPCEDSQGNQIPYPDDRDYSEQGPSCCGN